MTNSPKLGKRDFPVRLPGIDRSCHSRIVGTISNRETSELSFRLCNVLCKLLAKLELRLGLEIMSGSPMPINCANWGIRGQICLQKFNVEDAYNTECVVTSYQKRYFYTESIEQAKEELR